MRERQVNVRLTPEEYRQMRAWAFALEESVSDFARTAMIERAQRLDSERRAGELQLSLPNADEQPL